jgi:hypothetical protein
MVHQIPQGHVGYETLSPDASRFIAAQRKWWETVERHQDLAPDDPRHDGAMAANNAAGDAMHKVALIGH